MHFTYNHGIFIPKQHIYQPKAKESQTQTHLRTLTCETLSYIKQNSHPSMAKSISSWNHGNLWVQHHTNMFITKDACSCQNMTYLLLTLQHLSTYGIMNGHVNACLCHQSKKQTWNPNLSILKTNKHILQRLKYAWT